MPAIHVNGLQKSYAMSDGNILKVLDDFSFDVEDGEFVCILGPSGCGKSTTLDILAGLTSQDEGEVHIGEGGRNSTDYGYVFQRPRLLDWRTVRDNLEFVLSAAGTPRQEWDRRVGHYLEMVGLNEFAETFPLQLSGGMQQRTSIARAFVIEPGVLLMDEPFSALDELTARKLRSQLTRLWQQERRTIIFVTHNALEAAFLADRIYVTSPRPASLVGSLTVDVPRPRRPDDPRLIELQHEIIQMLESGGAELDESGAVEQHVHGDGTVRDSSPQATHNPDQEVRA